MFFQIGLLFPLLSVYVNKDNMFNKNIFTDIKNTLLLYLCFIFLILMGNEKLMCDSLLFL